MPRESGVPDDGPQASSVQLNASAAQAAMNAKVKTLPALQANQDPFGTLVAVCCSQK